MKLTTFILITTILHVSAASFGQKINLKAQNAPLEKVFQQIRKQTGVDFLFDATVLKSANKVNINVSNASLEETLKSCFEGQNLDYVINDRSVIISKKTPSFLNKVISAFSNMDVQGRVIDEKGNLLSGANVMIMGTNRGYGTGESGRFILNNMVGDETLITSYLGYKTDTLKLHGQKNVTIRMVPVAAVLAEVGIVVNTGYQELNKERATGAFGKPDMEIFKSRTGTPDIMARLDGLVPGLMVIPGPTNKAASGFTGTGNQRSVIRGKSSVQLQSEPLYVVNGVQVTDLSTFNPDDVQDITVLKDAAAASIYGVQAANGVIVITTKKGNPYRKIKINYSGYFNFQNRPDYENNHLPSSGQFIQAARETFDAVNNPLISLSRAIIAPHEQILYDQDAHKTDPAYVARTNAQLDSLGKIDNRKQILDLWYQNALVMNHTLSASGGSEAYNFYTSLSYADNQTTTKGADNNAYRINFNQTFSPVRRLKISLNTSLNNTLTNSDNSISVNSTFIPYQLFKDANGNNIKLNYLKGLSPGTLADFQTRSGINLDYSPLDERNAAYSKKNVLTMNVTGNVNLNIWKGLSFDGTYGYQKSLGNGHSYKDISTYDSRFQLVNLTKPAGAGSPITYLLPTTGGRYATDNVDLRYWTLRNQLVYKTNPGNGRDNLSIQIGQEVLEQLSKRESSILMGYDEDLQTYTLLDYVALSKGVPGTVTGYGSFSESPYNVSEELRRSTSLFGLFNYTYNGKFSLDASIRQDKTNLFGSEHASQKKPVYSIGTKWLMGKEDFIKSIDWLDDLGLRATYGIMGNSPYSAGASKYDILRSINDPITGMSLTLATPANDKVSFEKTRTINVGLDFALFKNRISGTMEVYAKKTTDMLGAFRTNPLTGTINTTGNLGNLSNKGIELTLRSENLRTQDFTWSTGFVFSYNINKLISYSEPQPSQLTASGRLSGNVVDYPIGPLFAYRFAGLDHTYGDPQILLANGTVTKQMRAATANDLVYMGTTVPKFNGGLTNTFRYKSLSVSANMVYNLGHVMRKPVNRFWTGRLTAEGFSGSMLSEFLDRWKKPGDEEFTNVPSFVSNQSLNYTRRNTDYYSSADINVIDASYIKLRDVTLSYNLSRSILRAIRIEAVNVFVQTGNYMLWKANKDHVDPENPYDYIYGRTGRTFSIGANVTF